MALYTDIKYLHLISSELPKFKAQKRNVWNFRCPICKDSEKHKNKARGFIFEYNGVLMYKCHNCQLSCPFPKLLEAVSPIQYQEYQLESFRERHPPKISPSFLRKVSSTTKEFSTGILSTLTPVDSLNNSHKAKEYLLNRKLPTQALYFTEKFKEWTNSVKPDTFEDTSKDEPRIIIPLIDETGIIFGCQGRAINPTSLRYITILLDDAHTKVFGLNTVDFTKTIYITEGPFDSLLLDNSISMSGSSIADCSCLSGRSTVYVYDNEPRNGPITNAMSKLIQSGESIVIWPSSIIEKDINDMHLAGHNVNKLVKENTYNGLQATLKFNSWRK